jgi:hypothetical protein
MMRRFCDTCGVEIDRNMVTDRYRPIKFFRGPLGGVKVMLEVLVTMNGTANSGDICLPCLRSVFTEGQEIK